MLPFPPFRHHGMANFCRLSASAALFLAVLPGIGARNAHAQTFSSPSVFAYTGADQSYTVPAGISLLQVEVWGAGGGGDNGSIGGNGGFAGGDLMVTPGEVLTIVTGSGGGAGTYVNGNGYGGGGAGTGYAGGGRSAIDTALGGTTTELITAGGGGGGAGPGNHPSPPNYTFYNGGNAGGLARSSGSVSGLARGGGTQTAGGSAGGSSFTFVPATAGSQFLGGQGGGPSEGGGGGGGYYGGGGGYGLDYGAGGGGSSYLSGGLAAGTGTFTGAGLSYMSSDYAAYGTNNPLLQMQPPSVGVGGSNPQSTSYTHVGGNGLVIVRAISGAAAPEPAGIALLALGGLPGASRIARRRRRAAVA